MNGPANGSAENEALDLPAFSLDVQALDLGADVKAIGLELLETESREPVRGKEAAEFWAAAFPLLANNEHYALDFFSHLDRVREFCVARNIVFRDAGARSLVISQPSREELTEIANASRRKRLASDLANAAKKTTRNLPTSFPAMEWMVTATPTSAIRFARSASWTMAG